MKSTLLLAIICALACASCTSGSAVSAITSSPLANYSLVPTADISTVGEIDLFGVAVDAPGVLGIELGRKSDRATLYRLHSTLEACEAIVLRADGDDIEVLHLRGRAVSERFPFLTCEGVGAERSTDIAPRVLWRGR